MKRFILALLLAALACLPTAQAQQSITTHKLTITGITGSTQCLHVSTTGLVSGFGSDCGGGLSAIADKRLLANISGGSAAPIANTFSDIVDAALTCSAQGSVIYRGASGWACLAPGTSGQFLKTLGAAANPLWATPAGSGNVTGPGSSVTGHIATFGDTSGTLLADGGALATIATSGSASDLSSGSVPVARLGASPASHAVPVDVAGTSTYKVVPDCTDTGGNHINYTQSTDAFSCGTSGGGGSSTVLTPLEQHGGLNWASLSFTTGFTGSCTDYKISFRGLTPVSGGADLWVRFNGDTGGDYIWQSLSTEWSVNTPTGTSSSGFDTKILLATSIQGNGSHDDGFNGEFWLYDVNDTTNDHRFHAEYMYEDSGNHNHIGSGSGYFFHGAAITTMQVLFSTGNGDGTVTVNCNVS